MTVTVLLADDHHLVRQGLRALLQTEANLQVVGEAADGLAVMPLVERLRPQVLLLDLMMPGLNGLEVIRQVVQRAPRTRVVVVSMHADYAHVAECLRLGACGYILKESGLGVLVQAIQEVLVGRQFLGPPLCNAGLHDYRQKVRSTPLDRYETLTTREREVLQLAAESLTNQEISQRLFISPRTVETHRSNLMRKLDLATPYDLIRYALTRGIVPIAEE